MKEQIKNELEQFNKIYNDLNNELSMSILTDIVGYMAEIKKENDKEVLDFKILDESINNIKELLNSIPIENIKAIKDTETFKNTLKEDLEQNKRIYQECMYSIRTLNWILNDVLEGEEDKNA